MYNRYIPQPDGSFRRSRVPEPPHMAPPPPHKPQSQPQRSQIDPSPDPKPQPPGSKLPPSDPKPPSPGSKPQTPGGSTPPPPPKQEHHHGQKPPFSHQERNVNSFLKNLLPDSFDTGDLFIIMLLLLMAGDCEDNRNTALLTLALYFFM